MHTIEQRNTQETISLRVTMSCTQKMMVTVCKLQCAHGHYSHTLDGAPRAAHHPWYHSCTVCHIVSLPHPHPMALNTTLPLAVNAQWKHPICSLSALRNLHSLPCCRGSAHPTNQCSSAMVFHPLVPSSSTPLTQGCTVWSMGPRPTRSRVPVITTTDSVPGPRAARDHRKQRGLHS